MWLLKGFERITGCPTGRYRAELLTSALRYRDEATGCLVDEGDASGNIKRHSPALLASNRNREGVGRAGRIGRSRSRR